MIASLLLLGWTQSLPVCAMLVSQNEGDQHHTQTVHHAADIRWWSLRHRSAAALDCVYVMLIA